jgi:putative hemolysin
VPIPSITAGLLATIIGSLFAAGDAALQALAYPRLQALGTGTTPDAAAFRRYAANRIQIGSRWLAGRIVGLSLAAALFSQAAGSWLVPNLAIAAAVVGAVVSYGSFAEILSTLARRRPEQAGALALRVLTPFEWLLIPFAWPLSVLGGVVDRRVPEIHPADPRMTETELEWAVSVGEKSGTIANEPAEMIRNVLDFKDLTAREVMIPRRRVSAIESEMKLEDVLALVTTDGHSRYPVYRETLDNVVGLLYVKDLFALVRDRRLGQAKLSDLLRAPVLFVAETQPAASVLREMRGKRLHMAVVSDEFGGTGGIVTLEDILEEIVGEIHDEYDTDHEEQIEKVGDNHFVADAAISIGDLSSRLGKELPVEGDFESLGGLLVHRAGKVPPVGSTLTVDGLTFIVREADETHIVKVEIVPAETEEEKPVTQPSATP